ncbi:unnamed protein product [Cuscuta europaea]|uniref:Uncharacterized protein n=1 Tax=Cuscuta europaea TaxID=41803 RepID=A0A9P1EG12_CUSEU|nr:unnamed protein product [Cuscuta europaea]
MLLISCGGATVSGVIVVGHHLTGVTVAASLGGVTMAGSSPWPAAFSRRRQSKWCGVCHCVRITVARHGVIYYTLVTFLEFKRKNHFFYLSSIHQQYSGETP